MSPLGLILFLPYAVFSQEVGLMNDPDPFADGEVELVKATEQGAKKTVSLFLRAEVYEMPVAEAMALLDEELLGKKMRKRLLKMVGGKIAEVASMHGLRFEADGHATNENIVEDIYPTEYEPPEVLPEGSPLLRPHDELTPSQRVQKVAVTFASPSAFDTKNLGTTLEAEASTVTAEKGMWDLAFTLTEVNHLKDDSWVEGTIVMPIFRVNSTKGNSRVKDGAWTLWSCQPPSDEDGKPDLSRVRFVLIKLQQMKR